MADDYSGDINTTGNFVVGGMASGSIEARYDSDWFRIKLVAGTTYQFALGGALAATFRSADMPTLALIDPATNGANAGTKVSQDGPSVMRYKPVASGDFYVDVHGAAATGNYTVSATALGTDDHPDGHTTTDRLALGGQVGGVIEIAGDHDAFLVSVEAGKTYTLTAAGVGGAAAALPLVGLYSQPEDGRLAVLSGGGDAGTTSFTAVVSATYYAVVRDIDELHGTGGYVLNLTAAADDYAASAAGAVALAPGAAKVAGVINVAGDLDWFKVSLAAGQSVLVLLGDSEHQLNLALVDRAGAVVSAASQFQSGGVTLAYSAATAGDYYVQVQARDSSPNPAFTSAYSLQLLPGADDYSANSQSVGMLADGASVQGIFGSYYDADWIKVHLQAGSSYNFGLTSLSPFGAAIGFTGMTLVDASGKVAALANGAAGTTTSDALMDYYATLTGDYFVAVGGQTYVDTGSTYKLTSYVQHADAVPADRTTPATLSAGQLLTGVIDTPADLDWFALSTTANNLYTVVLSGAADGDGTLGAPGAAPLLKLFDADGVLQASGSSYLGASTLSFRSSVASTYYVQVGGAGLGTGTYTVRAADLTHLLADRHAPVFSSLTGGTTADARADNLSITFDETVLRGDGIISLRLASGALVETFDVGTSSRLAFAGTQLTLDPSADLLPGTDYVIELGAASVKDAAGNAYAGATTHALHTAEAGSRLVGGAGNDVFHATGGNDRFDGGAGRDAVVYSGARDGYFITQGVLGNQVFTYNGTQSSDTLVAIERVVFDNGAVAFDIEGNAGQVYRLYQAAFARVPDQAGVGYWIAQSDAGASVQAVAAAFATSAEFTSLYGARLTDAQFVTQLYQNVLHRAPDAGGLAFWTEGLAHAGTRADTLVAFSESPENQLATFVGMSHGIVYTPFLA